MQSFRAILGAMYREEITEEEAQEHLKNLGEDALAEFIIDAFDRNWITNFNLGLDEDGNDPEAGSTESESDEDRN